MGLQWTCRIHRGLPRMFRVQLTTMVTECNLGPKTSDLLLKIKTCPPIPMQRQCRLKIITSSLNKFRNNRHQVVDSKIALRQVAWMMMVGTTVCMLWITMLSILRCCLPQPLCRRCRQQWLQAQVPTINFLWSQASASPCKWWIKKVLLL